MMSVQPKYEVPFETLYLPSPGLATDYGSLRTETCIPCRPSLLLIYLRTSDECSPKI